MANPEEEEEEYGFHPVMGAGSGPRNAWGNGDGSRGGNDGGSVNAEKEKTELKVISQEEMKEILQKHKMWLEGHPDGVQADLSKTLVRDIDLAGVDLTGAIAVGTIFDKVRLDNAIMHGVQLDDSIFQECKMNNVKLSYAGLSGVDFKGGEMVGIKMDNVFTQKDWVPTISPETKKPLENKEDIQASRQEYEKTHPRQEGRVGVQFLNCNMEGAILNGANLENAYFYKCKMDNAKLKEALLGSNTVFDSGSMKNVNLEEARQVKTEPIVEKEKVNEKVQSKDEQVKTATNKVRDVDETVVSGKPNNKNTELEKYMSRLQPVINLKDLGEKYQKFINKNKTTPGLAYQQHLRDFLQDNPGKQVTQEVDIKIAEKLFMQGYQGYQVKKSIEMCSPREIVSEKSYARKTMETAQKTVEKKLGIGRSMLG